jgi:predicted Zn-dependent peptidase
LAHLCEHLKFIGGGRATARTFPDRTVFSETVAARDLRRALARERVRMTEHRFAEERLEADRRLLIVERRQMVEERPFGQDFEELHRRLYPPGHPYHLAPVGTFEGLRAICRADAEELSRNGYRPERAVLAIVGDLDHAAVVAACEEAFADLPGKRWREPAVSQLESSDPTPDAPPVVASRVPHPRVYVAWRGPGFARKDCYAASLLLRSLAIGQASPLARLLVERLRVARQVQAHIVPMREASTLAVAVDGMAGVDPGRLQDETLLALEELVTAPLAEERLANARRKALTDLWSSLQRPADRASYLATLQVFLGRPAGLAEVESQYEAVTVERVAEVARSLWREARRTVLTVVPERGRP